MKRYSPRRALTLIAMALLTLAVRPSSVAACSGPEPTIEVMAESARLIAIGTLSQASLDTITLDVDEYYKGALAEPALSLNNHRLDPSGDGSCQVVLTDGNWLADGTRVVAFLVPDEYRIADWRPARGGIDYILEIGADDMLSYAGLEGAAPPIGGLNEALATLERLGYLPSEPAGSGGGSGGSGGGDDPVVDLPAVNPPVVDLPVLDPPVIDIAPDPRAAEPGEVPGGAVKTGREPAVMPPDMVMPANPVLVDPGFMPVPLPAPGRGVPVPNVVEAEPGGDALLPRVALGALLAISSLLALWALAQQLRRAKRSS